MTESPIRSPISAAIRSPLDWARSSVGGGGPPADDFSIRVDTFQILVDTYPIMVT